MRFNHSYQLTQLGTLSRRVKGSRRHGNQVKKFVTIMVANLNRVHESGVALRDAVIIGATERFRPVLMTATVATIGMMPAALATGVGTDMQRALATVVVGGLIFATLLTLFILAVFYYSLEQVALRWVGRGAVTEPTAMVS